MDLFILGTKYVIDMGKHSGIRCFCWVWGILFVAKVPLVGWDVFDTARDM
jgi:hypothetical protein